MKASIVLALSGLLAAALPRAARGAVVRVPEAGVRPAFGSAPLPTLGAPSMTPSLPARALSAAPSALSAPSAPTPLHAAAAPAAVPPAAPRAADLELPGHRLWDNWGYYDKASGVYHRFALASPATLRLEELDHASRIHHFTSFDGKRWDDAGAFLNPGFAPQAGAVWSGSAHHDGSAWRMYFTARRSGPAAAQSVWVMKASASGRWGRPRLLMDSTDPAFRARAEALGYHLGSADGIVSALRDPFRDGDTLYFAAKGVSGGAVRPAVGRARLVRGRVVLLPPLFPPIPASWTQIELPQVVTVDGRRLMTMAVSNGGRLAGAPSKPRTGQLFFRMNDAGGLERPPKGDRLRGLLLPRRGGLYTANQLREAPGGPLLLSFRTPASKGKPFTLPPPLTLDDLRK